MSDELVTVNCSVSQQILPINSTPLRSWAHVSPARCHVKATTVFLCAAHWL